MTIDKSLVVGSRIITSRGAGRENVALVGVARQLGPELVLRNSTLLVVLYSIIWDVDHGTGGN